MNPTVKTRRKIAGVGLVELMISVLLGGLIAVAVVQLYLHHQKSFQAIQGLSFTQQQGSYALEYFRADLMQSLGSDTQVVTHASAQLPYYSIDGPYFDSMVIRLARGRDCVGDELQKHEVVWKRYYVREGQLFCSDSDRQTVGLLEDVEALQILYAIDESGNGSVDRFVSASNLQETQVVMGVRIGVLLRSPYFSAAIPAKDGLTLLDQHYGQGVGDAELLMNDGHRRGVFVTTVALRNGRL